MTFKTRGTCASQISFDLVDGTVHNVKFTGGCNGNLKGISSILREKTLDEVIEAFEGIQCGPRSTSCPDQIAQALKQYKAQM